MTDMKRDLEELGQRLWPSTSGLRPRNAEPASRAGFRRLAAVAVAAGTAAAFAAVLAFSLSHRAANQNVHRNTVALGSPITVGDSRGDGAATRLRMVSAAAGWAWGPVYVGRTADGFHSIADVTPSSLSDLGSHAVAVAIDAKHFWLAGTAASTTGVTAAVLRTSDGGATWTENSFTFGSGLQITPSLMLAVADTSNGWIEADYRQSGSFGHFLFGTQDGGASWQTLATTIVPPPPSAPPLPPGASSSAQGIPATCGVTSLSFQTSTDGFATAVCGSSGFTMLITSDGGATWASTPSAPWASLGGDTSPVTGFGPHVGTNAAALALASRSCPNGVSAGATHFFSGSNGGQTWTHVGSAPEIGIAYDALPSGQMLLVPTCGGPNSTPLVSSDGGQKWTPVSSWPGALLSPGTFVSRSFDVTSPTSAVALTFDSLSRATQYYASSDGGATFSLVNSSGGTPGQTPSPTSR